MVREEVPDKVVLEVLVPVLEEHSRTDKVALEASVLALEGHSRTDMEALEVLVSVWEEHSHSDRAASAADRMDNTGSRAADMALAWEALEAVVAPASACVHEHRAHPEQN